MSAPYTDYRYELVFGDAPHQLIMLRETHRGVVVKQQILGSYVVGQTYQAQVRLDRKKSRLSISIMTPPGDVVDSPALIVASGDSKFGSHILTDQTVPVAASGVPGPHADLQ